MWIIPGHCRDPHGRRSGVKISGYQFQSCFAPYIEMFLQEKRAAGFIYESEEWKLKHFDAFCMEGFVTEPRLSRDLVKKGGTYPVRC